jgi:quercetin dioxygenase-like cupin family protein
MKKITVHEWDGMLLSLFQMDAGDKIEQHSHPFQHTTGVARGSTRVTLFGDVQVSTIMHPGDRDFPFPANLEHEIEAMEDDTIIVNLSHSQTPAGEPARNGGLELEDGTIVFASSLEGEKINT